MKGGRVKNFVLSIGLVLIVLPNVMAEEAKYASSDPSTWYYEKIGPKEQDAFGRRITQTVYLFKRHPQKKMCGINVGDECPYKMPSFDGSERAVNRVLNYLGLPVISSIHKNGKWNYTTPNYPLGELHIFARYKHVINVSIWKYHN